MGFLGRVGLLNISLFLVVAVTLAASAALYLGQTSATGPRHRPVEQAGDGYVSSDACRSCHPGAYKSWHRSYHRTMTQVASDDSVMGDFDGVTVMADGNRIDLSRQDGRFMARMSLPDLEGRGGDWDVDVPVVMTTGSHHMQAYWFATGEGRMLGEFPLTYLKEDQRWITRRAAFLRPPGRPRKNSLGSWNTGCINCHTTHGQPRVSPNGVDTQVGEFGIACEACHGPGKEHIELNASPLRRLSLHLKDGGDDSIVQPERLSAARASEVCSQCHAIWQFGSDAAGRDWIEHGHAFRPGGKHDKRWLFRPSQADTDPRVASVWESDPGYVLGQFWPDGMARVSSREYNAMVDSPCYGGEELSCLSCHTLHKKADDPRSFDAWADDQLGVGMRTNKACLQCHKKFEAKLTEHTGHGADSTGSLCYNCHTPYTTYGLLKAIRAHFVSSPDVGDDLKTGRPNACNLCHLDRSLAWTARELKQRYQIEPPALTDAQRQLPASALWMLKGDAGQRALLAWHMAWEPALQVSGRDWIAPVLSPLLDDDYDAVRYLAGRAMKKLGAPGMQGYDFMAMPTGRDPRAPGVVAAWRAQSGRPNKAPAGLFDATGDLQEQRVNELWKNRDRRKIHLIE